MRVGSTFHPWLKGTMFTVARRSLQLVGGQRRRRFVAVSLLSVLVSVLEAVAAVLVLVLLRFVLEPGSLPELPVVGDVGRFFPDATYATVVTRVAIVFGVFFVIRGGLFLLQQYALAKVAQNTGVMLADRLVTGYLSMPYEFHLQRNSSELVRNAYDNVAQVVSNVFTPMMTLVAELALTVAMVAVLLLTSVQVTVAAVVIMGLAVGLSLSLVQPRLKARGRQRQEAALGAIHHLQQGFGALRDIKVLGKEAVFSGNHLRMRIEMAEAEYHRVTLAYVPRVTMEVSFLLLVVGALVVAVGRNSVGELLPTLGLFAYAGLRLQPSLQKIANSANGLRYAEAAIDDLMDDLQLLDADRVRGAADDEPGGAILLRESLELRGVSFRYEGADRDALRQIDLRISKGESLGIAGATGGGKTTLLDIVCGLLQPTGGGVYVDGQPLAGHVRAWQRGLGVVHQHSFLVDDTLRANVALGVPDIEVDDRLLARCLELAQLRAVVSELPQGVDTHVGEAGVRLSGGQRQRVALARALYRQPSVLILDEGTAALDNDTERAIIRGVEELAGDTTIIMVAHRMTTIEGCDRIAFLKDGRVDAIGTFEDLMRSHPGFRRMAAHVE